MDLVLWRHAEAHEAADPADDLSRPLTAKGERHARRMAAWLNRQLPERCKVLVSPALRAQQTAEALDRRFKTVDSLAPEASADALLAAARWPDSRETVLVVGHQPTLGLTGAYLLTGQPLPWAMRKGGIWWLRGREREGELQVVLFAALSPELL